MATIRCGVVVVTVFLVFCAIGTVTSATTDWVLQPCTQDSDCTSKDANAKCFSEKCLCKPNYFYSNSGKNCIVGCSGSNLQSAKILKYRNITVMGRTTLETLGGDRTRYQCKQACVSNSACISASFEETDSASVCYLQSSISSDTVMPYIENVPTHTFFQKRCA